MFPRMLRSALECHADKVAFLDGSYQATFEQHGDRVFRLAHALAHGLGVEKHQRFAVMALNGHEFLELYHAAFVGAGVVNPLNLRLAGKELQYILADSGTEVVFVDSFFAEHLARNVEEVRDELPLRTVVLIGDGDGPHDVRYEDLVDSGHPVIPAEPDEDDPVVLMYTGGTTGLSKGVLLDQRAEMLNLYHIGMVVGLDEERVYLHQTPMFHAASMGGVLGIPASGGTSVFCGIFDPGQVLDLIEQHQVNQTVMVPTMIAMMLNHPSFEVERLRSLDTLVYGASPMPTALLERVRAQLPGLRLFQGYGMTESSSVLTLLTDRDHEAAGELLASAGRAVPGVQLSIQDDAGNILDPGATGEVCAKAGNFMLGYWNKPEATEEAFRDGWYHTGDAGYLDERGYLYLVDRVKDMIVTGGENVYSIEVENAIATHPAVDQVAVIGIPHEVWGEAVHAIVVLVPGAEVTDTEIIEHAKLTVAGYKAPKTVEFRAEPLPLSGALKPLKRELRRPYWEGSGRSVN